ncbi:MAG: hypothetical protein JW913_05230 [Chitinispirillaceae bacterium]|nr:hypothetical protein [Chitinispirillaceae bacterium]
MNSATVTVRSFSSIDAAGITTAEGFIAWESGQAGPRDIRRPQVLSAPYVAFGKLNLPDKLVFSASSLALRGRAPVDPEKTGIFLGIPHGSLSTDLLYRESLQGGAPSPALFSATLPSSAVTDIAIYHHIKGPDVVFAGGDAPLFAALEYGVMMLQCRRCTEALIVYVDEGTIAVRAAPTQEEIAPGPCAYALLLGTCPPPPVPPLPLSAIIALKRIETSDNRQPSGTERELMARLITALLKKESLRIPVSSDGFRGYISLQCS